MARHKACIKTKFKGGPLDGKERTELQPDDKEIYDILLSDRVHQYTYNYSETSWTYLGVKEPTM